MKRFDVSKRIGGLVIVIITAAAFLAMGCDSTGESGAGGTSTPADPGTVAVSLSGATDLEGDLFGVFLYAHDEHSINTPARLLAVNTATIGASGNVDLVLKEDNGNFEPTQTTFVGAAGATYDMYIYTDSEDNGTEGGTDDYEPCTSLRAYHTVSFPQTVTIDGDQSVSVARATMTEYTGGTVTVELSNATAYDDKWFYYAIFLAGAVPGTDDALAWAEKKISGGVAQSAEDDLRARSDNGTFYAWHGTTYDLYAMIDMDGTGHSSGISTGDLLYQAEFTLDSGDTTNISTDAANYTPFTGF